MTEAFIHPCEDTNVASREWEEPVMLKTCASNVEMYHLRRKVVSKFVEAVKPNPKLLVFTT